MELIDRLKEVLKEEFNICSDEELLEAVQSMPELDLAGASWRMNQAADRYDEMRKRLLED